MAVINKITRVYPDAGQTVSDEQVQAHLDEMNTAGWEIVAVIELVGWFRIFWKKTVE